MGVCVVLLIDGSTEWRGREKPTALNISSSQPTDWRPREKAPAVNRCSSQPAERRPRREATTPKISSSLPDVSSLNRGWFKLYTFNSKVLKQQLLCSFLTTVIKADCLIL